MNIKITVDLAFDCLYIVTIPQVSFGVGFACMDFILLCFFFLRFGQKVK
jgi:hypothetical protein